MFSIDHSNGLAPPGFLTVVDFTKIENLPLTNLAVRKSLVLDYGPVPMLFTIFIPLFIEDDLSCKIVTRIYWRQDFLSHKFLFSGLLSP